MFFKSFTAPVVALVIGAAVFAATTASVHAKAQDYRFELAGKPQLTGGKDIVRVRLVHVPDNTPVSGAVIFETKADMGPAGMPTMTAPIKALPAREPGIYQFEIEPGMAGAWAINLAAKVQGKPETVHTTITADLVK